MKAPEFEYATGVAPGMEDVTYQSRSPEAIEVRFDVDDWYYFDNLRNRKRQRKNCKKSFKMT